MGCTSSTSIIPEDQIKSTDKTIIFSKGTDICNIQNEGVIKKNEQELRKDLVNDVQQLEQSTLVLKDPLYSENIHEKQETINFNTDQNDEQKTQENTSSKEIEEHVISNNIENQKEIKTNYSDTSLSGVVNYETETNLEESIQEIVSIITEDVHRGEIQESGSPCQSDCSRATRWEALADMAAELPPSLTVDPITGQIYAVSK